MKSLAVLFSIATVVFCTSASAQHNPAGHNGHAGHGATQPPSASYAGQQTRTVTSLSDDELTGLPAGKGLGLAKPAELNGFPGPMHVLELADKLALTSEQRSAVQAIFERMSVRAKAAGAAYIDAERMVDDVFRSSGKPDALVAANAISGAEAVRSELRMAHLSAHLETTPILTPQQRAIYAKLRGYSAN
jgi:Spy/CpxP family protein refolding chaperone